MTVGASRPVSCLTLVSCKAMLTSGLSASVASARRASSFPEDSEDKRKRKKRGLRVTFIVEFAFDSPTLRIFKQTSSG